MAFGFSAHIVFAESSSDDEPELRFSPVDDDVLQVKSPLAVDDIFTPSPHPTKPEDVYQFNGSDDGTRAVTPYCLFVCFIFNAIMLVSELEPAPLRSRTDAPAAPAAERSVSPISTGPIASGNSQEQDEEDDDERLLRPKRLTVVEKLASSTDTQVRPVHPFES